jgi:hypothetical protein
MRSGAVVRLSIHIQREMPRRGITAAYIEAVLANPTYTTLDPTDPTLTRSFSPVPAFGNCCASSTDRTTATFLW